MKLRKADTRGHIVGCARFDETNFESYRSFDFEGYKSGIYFNWGPIVTINDDRTQPGFITTYHEHKNLDILSYVIQGTVHHHDSLGNELQSHEGQVQHMSCGSGIWHTEANTGEEPNRYVQIWIVNNQFLLDWEPRYTLIDREPGFKKLPVELKNTKLEVWCGNLGGTYDIDCYSYLLVLEGSCSVDEINLEEGDALEITQPSTITAQGAHLILFKLKR
jgi:redox-sensitive bicupin YhaK (pirin superfamily)